MVRAGFDRQDLMDMPQPELLEWYKELNDQLRKEQPKRKGKGTS